MERRTLSCVAVMTALTGTTCAVAATPADVIQARQQKYKAMGKTNKTLQEELKKPVPSLDVIQVHSAELQKLAAQIPRWFPKGTGPEAGVKTGARPEIWQQPAKFKSAANDLASVTKSLYAFANRGDLAGVKAAGAKVGLACKACHDGFRQKD